MTGRLSEDRLMEPLVINGRRRGVVRRALVGLALTTGCVYALVQGVRYTHIVSLLLGTLGAPFLGLLTIGWIRLLGPIALVVDDRGMMDSASMPSVGFIPWEQTLAFLPVRTRGKGSVHDYVFILFADSMWPWSRLRGCGVPEALDGLYVEYLRRSGEAGLPPPPGDGAPQAQAWTGGLGRSTTAWRAAPPPGAGGPMANSI